MVGVMRRAPGRLLVVAVLLALAVVGCGDEEVGERVASESQRGTAEVSSTVSGGGAGVMVEPTGTAVRLADGASEVVGKSVV